MNREIKFRAWDNENKYMVISKQGVFTALRNSMNIVRQDNGYYNDGDLLKPNKEKYILMQYTGLDDKNGKEIYEGDIVLLDCYYYEEPAFDGEFKVIYDDINGMWLLVDLEDKENIYTFENIRGYYKTEIEVIGNMYDNPELLGGE